MSKLTEAVPKEKTPLSDMLAILEDADLKHLNALELTAACRRAEGFLEAIRTKLLPEANAAFTATYSADEKQKKLVLLDGKVIATKYSPRCFWTYPAAVVKLENELREKQKVAQADGTAVKKTPVSSATLFAIELIERF